MARFLRPAFAILTSTSHPVTRLLLALALLLTGTAGVAASTMVSEDLESRHIALAGRGRFDSVGQVSTDRSRGSGVLIDSEWFLTAAHVVDDAARVRFDVGGQTYTVSGWYTPGSWSRAFYQGNDLALVRLTQPTAGVRTADLQRRSRVGGGRVAINVGYGLTGDGETGAYRDSGVKRAFRNALDLVDRNNANQLISDFDDPADSDDAINFEGAIGAGDSGGGVFVGHRLAGIQSWGAYYDTMGAFGSLNYATDVSRWRRWIRSRMREVEAGDQPGGALIGRPGEAIFVDGPEASFHASRARASGFDGASLKYESFRVNIPEPASLLLLGAGLAAVVVGGRRTREG